MYVNMESAEWVLTMGDLTQLWGWGEGLEK